MLKLSSFFTACTVAALAALVTDAAMAQGGRWFRVELLVFANESAPSAGSAAEHWDPTPPLRYPDAARFLIDPARVKANRARYPGLGDVDEYGRQVLETLSIEAPDVSKISTDDSEDFEQDSVTDQAAAPATGPASGPGPADEEAALPAEDDPAVNARAFVILPSGQLQFRGKAALMQKSGRYRILFHETWLQPVLSKARTLPIILDNSGDGGDWPRLQGSITLYLSRYLHLETNLWLNTDGNYLPGEWQMPAPPLAPPSLIIEEQPTGPVDSDEVWIYQPGSAPVAAPGEGQAPAEPAATEEADAYPYRHALLLKQKRRMRSKEVHYIDHPKFGIVIKVTPVTREDLDALAATTGN